MKRIRNQVMVNLYGHVVNYMKANGLMVNSMGKENSQLRTVL